MQGLDLEIRLDCRDGTYRPGDIIRGEVEVRTDRPVACERLIVRRLWRAHGAGNPEEGRASFHDLYHGEWAPGSAHRYPFELTLPNGPATYHGRLLDVSWYIDARAEIPLAAGAAAEVELPLEPGPCESYSFGPAHPPWAEGHPGDGGGEGWKVILGGALAGTGLASLIAWGALGFSGLIEALGGGLLLLLGGKLAIPIVRRRAAEWRLGIPEVSIDGEEAHRGGRVLTRVALSPLVPVTLDGLEVDLVAREEVVRGQEVERTLDWKEVLRLNGSPDRSRRAIAAGEVLTTEAMIRIPTDAPLTFTGKENRLEWFVEVTVAISGWADWRRRFPVTVGPPPALAAAGILDAPAGVLLQEAS